MNATRIRPRPRWAVGLALAGLLVACGDDDGTRLPPPQAPPTAPPTTAAPVATTAPGGSPGSSR